MLELFCRRLTGAKSSRKACYVLVLEPDCRRAALSELVAARCDATFAALKSGFGWGSDMTSRLPLTAAFFLLLFPVLGLTAAHAADPAFCKPYAHAALNQVHSGLSNPACAPRLQGARWSTDFAVHYEWCLGASSAAAGDEREARTRFLRGCAGS
jgi:hypothetical protein